jgi:prevent-host-death family protein
MMRAALTELRTRGHDLLGRVTFGRERIVLERQGRPVAALVPLEDLELLEEMEEREMIEAADRAEAEPGEDIPWEQVKAELNL